MFWGFDVYIYPYIFHNIWKIFDARKIKTKEPSEMVLKLEPEARFSCELALELLAVRLQPF